MKINNLTTLKTDPKMRAFELLLTRQLEKKRPLTKSEVFSLFSGIRNGKKNLEKFDKNSSIKLLKSWNKLGIVKIYRGKVHVLFTPFLIKSLSNFSELEFQNTSLKILVK